MTGQWGLRTQDYEAYVDGFVPENVPRAHRVKRATMKKSSSQGENKLLPLTPVDIAVKWVVRLVLFLFTVGMVYLVWNYSLVDVCTVLKPMSFFQGCGFVIFINLVKNLGRHQP